MECRKRQRAANYNNAEVQLLVNLVEKYKQIVENKKTDAVTNKDKEAAWKKIESSFNSCGISTVERSWKTLKLKYEGLKKTTKKKSSIQRQELYRTGGGPSNAPDFNVVEEKVMSICSNLTGLEARHDSDTISNIPITVGDIVLMEVKENQSVDFNNEKYTENTAEELSIHIPDMDESFLFEENKDVNESQKENKWDKWHPKALKTRVSHLLKPDTANKTSVTTKLDKLSSARLELVQLQMEAAKKDLQFKEDEHKLKMEAAKKDLQLKEDEHKLKMEYIINDEKRKQEIHQLLLQKLNCASDVNKTVFENV